MNGKIIFRKEVKNAAVRYKIYADNKDKILIEAIESFTYTHCKSKELDTFDLRLERDALTDKHNIYILYRYCNTHYEDVTKKDVERVADLIKKRYGELKKEEEYTFYL